MKRSPLCRWLSAAAREDIPGARGWYEDQASQPMEHQLLLGLQTDEEEVEFMAATGRDRMAVPHAAAARNPEIAPSTTLDLPR